MRLEGSGLDPEPSSRPVVNCGPVTQRTRWIVLVSAFFQYTINGLTVGAFLALVALGYTMVYGVIRLINFAHGDVFMVGSFIGYTVLTAVAAKHWPVVLMIVLALVAGMAFTGGLGMLMEQVAYKPLLNAPPLAILISALGVSLALEESARIKFGAGFSAYPNLLPTGGYQLGTVRISYSQMGMVLLALMLMSVLYMFVQRTATGTAMRALAMDRDAARLMGINVEGTILLTFLIGSMLAGAAGVMQGLYYTQINFTMGFLVGLRAFTAAVLGGIGNIPGAMVAGFLIGLIQSYAAGYVSTQWNDAIIFAVLIGVLVFKPTGIFGERVVERV
jgi:branched-chain amino acid transport system permease protein